MRATKISSKSRVVKKSLPSKNLTSRRTLKRSDKVKKYSLKTLNEYFEQKFKVSIDSEQKMTSKQKRYRNKYLFPAIKDSAQSYNNTDILFDEKDALNYLQTLSRTLDKSDDYYMEEVPFIEVSKQSLSSETNKEGKVMIKKISNLSTISEPNSSNEESKGQDSENEDYVDPYEQEYLNRLKSESNSPSKKQHMKWLGKALDCFRSVENHKKSGMLYKPYIHSDIDSFDRNLKVDMSIAYPITLKTVGVKLSLNLYNKYEEFKRDMMCVFKNSNLTSLKTLL
ncbi:unnamed protein product [Moneuplotes crassus]|uniref:Bromo domain-containing protein n=1 Tax=Euplotes crassus TaxID=5936 RepID=A0AAD1XM67_EUPCR|nr:unnamed protein product [Moneuplotes crassus]